MKLLDSTPFSSMNTNTIKKRKIETKQTPSSSHTPSIHHTKNHHSNSHNHSHSHSRGHTQIKTNSKETKNLTYAQYQTPITLTLNSNVQKQMDSRLRRRSSLSRRGLRALDSDHLAAPHPSIPTHLFYRHISPDLSDVKRMKLLLLFCGAKNIQKQKKMKVPLIMDGSLSPFEVKSYMNLLRNLEIEMLRGIRKDKISISWICNPLKALAAPKLPNPANVEKTKSLQLLKAELERLKNEETQWREIFNNRIREHALRSDQLRSGMHSIDYKLIEESLDDNEKALLAPLPDFTDLDMKDLSDMLERTSSTLFELSALKSRLEFNLKRHRQRQYHLMESHFRIVQGEMSLPLIKALAQMSLES